MGPYTSLCVLMDFDVFLWVLIVSNASLCVFMGSYWFLSVLKSPSRYLFILIIPYGS